MDKLIAKKYAKALMGSGDAAALATRLETLKAVAAALDTPKVRDVIRSPLVPKQQKADLILTALGKGSDPILAKLVELMAQKNRLDLIPDMVAMIAFEQKKASNRFAGTVHTDTVLGPDAMHKLQASLAAYSGAEIALDQIPSDQTGIKVEVEDLGIELSFSRDKVKQALIDHIQKAF